MPRTSAPVEDVDVESAKIHQHENSTSYDPGEQEEGECDSAPAWAMLYESKKFQVSSLLPPITWLPAYFRNLTGKTTDVDKPLVGGLPFSIQGDLIAGLTVGIMLVPQCLAFAMLSGLPVQIGLYASFAPLVAYSLMGTIRQVQPGPTALMSLLTAQTLDASGLLVGSDGRVAGAAFMALLVGLISVVLGMCRVGFIVDFMSHSVMAAFCTAAGITIGTSQMSHMLGISNKRKKYWWKTVRHILTHLYEVDAATAIMSFTLLAGLLLLKYWKSAGTLEKRTKHPVWRFFPKDKTSRTFRGLKMLADLSSIIAVVVGWVWALIYRHMDITSVKLVGTVDSDGLVLSMPGAGFFDQFEIGGLFGGAAIIAIVGYLETMAVGGKFAAQARYEYDSNQELVALGFSNIASAFFSGYPVTGSFSRTAVNAMLGATSLLACGLSSVVVFLAIYVLLPVIAKLPFAALAPIIIQGALGVVDVHGFKEAAHASRSEFLVMLATLLVSLGMTVKEGLMVGFGLSVLKTMYDLAYPNLAVCGKLEDGNFRDIRNFPQAASVPQAVVVRMDARLNFVNSRKLKEFCIKALEVREKIGEAVTHLILDAKAINHVDLTGCEMLTVLAEMLHGRKQHLVVANVKGPVSKGLSLAHVGSKLEKCGAHITVDMDQALALVGGNLEMAVSASKKLDVLVKSVDTATLRLKQAQPAFYKCQANSSKPSLTQSPTNKFSAEAQNQDSV